MAKQTKQTRQQKIESLVAFTKTKLLNIGFLKFDSMRYDYYGGTKGGEIGISIWGHIDIKRFPPHIDIMMSFSDPDKARLAGFNCNPFSGKYNFHCVESCEQIENIINGLF